MRGQARTNSEVDHAVDLSRLASIFQAVEYESRDYAGGKLGQTVSLKMSQELRAALSRAATFMYPVFKSESALIRFWILHGIKGLLKQAYDDPDFAAEARSIVLREEAQRMDTEWGSTDMKNRAAADDFYSEVIEPLRKVKEYGEINERVHNRASIIMDGPNDYEQRRVIRAYMDHPQLGDLWRVVPSPVAAEMVETYEDWVSDADDPFDAIETNRVSTVTMVAPVEATPALTEQLAMEGAEPTEDTSDV